MKIKPVKHWYKQIGNTCPTYGLAMLFSYLTDIKLEEKQFLNVNKTILKILKDGDLGAKFSVKNFSKNSPAEFLNELSKNPLACDFTMFKGINYNADVIHHTEDDLIPLGGHRMLIIAHDTKTGMVYFANTSGKNKVQKMDFALFYYSLRKYMKLSLQKTEISKRVVPMLYTHFGYDWLSPVKGGGTRGFHPGVDFNYGSTYEDLGFPVLACADGIIVASEYLKDGWGNKVVIRHEIEGQPIYSRYGHLSLRALKVGSTVKAGDKIGLCGNTGNSTAPHLHFDLWKKKQATWGAYIYGWSKDKVLANYLNPKTFFGIK